MVHALPRAVPHPTWDILLDHVGANPTAGGVELRSWIHDLVLRPTRPQRALLLTGPETNGKTVFHDAMGLLLPEGGVVRMPEDMNYPPLDLKSEWWLEPDPRLRAEREAKLKAAWLMVVNDPLVWYMRLHKHPRFRDGRFLKWSYVCKEMPNCTKVRPMPPVIRFDVQPPGIAMLDLTRRLEDERDAFRETLLKYAA